MSETCPICEGDHAASTCPWPADEAVWSAGAVGGASAGGEERDLRQAVAVLGMALLVRTASDCQREIEVLETIDRDRDQRRRMARARKLIQAIRDLRAGRAEGAARSVEEAEEARPDDGWTAVVRGYLQMLRDLPEGAAQTFADATEGADAALGAGAALMAGRCALVAGQPDAAQTHMKAARAFAGDAAEPEIDYQLARSSAALEPLLEAAHRQPWIWSRARADSLLSMLAEPLAAAEQRLSGESAKAWAAAHERLQDVLGRTDRWLRLAETGLHDRYTALKDLVEQAEQRASEEDPFAGGDAAALVDERAGELDQLAADAREAATAAIIAAVAELEQQVEQADPALRATREWTVAQGVALELRQRLDGVGGRADDEAHELLEAARHEAGVQRELLEVTGEEVEQREKVVSEDRAVRHAADRAALAEVRGRLSSIHWMLGIGAGLILLLAWTGPLVLLSTIPPALALLRAATGRAMLRQRVWSIPRGEADDLAEELTTRLIIAVLLIVAVGIVMVIRWMLLSLA